MKKKEEEMEEEEEEEEEGKTNNKNVVEICWLFLLSFRSTFRLGVGKAGTSPDCWDGMGTISSWSHCEPAWLGGQGARLVSGRRLVRLPAASAHLSRQKM